MRHEPAWLYVDIDESEQEPNLGRMQALLTRAGFRMASAIVARSPSSTGWHVRLLPEPQPATPLEMVALQAILGSDPFREACNLTRVRSLPKASRFWRKRWNVLYLKQGGL